MEIKIKGFTDEQAGSLKSAIEKLSEELQGEVKTLLDDLAGKDALNAIKELLKEKDGKSEVLAEMQKQLDKLDVEMQKGKGMSEKEAETLEASVKSLLESDEFKQAKAAGFRQKQVFEVKAATSDITGTVNMTRQNLSIKFNPERSLAFLPRLNTGTLGQDKAVVLWVEGAYTSNVGYVGEGTGQATADTGTAAEKTRKMAKISAKLSLTAEMLEDAEYIASAFRMKMQEKALLFTDGEAYDGDGSDGGNPNHIYGIVGHATAYNSTTTGSAAAIEKANIGDLVDDAILQAELSEQRGLNTLWINPKDFARFKYAKDERGQYLFIKDVNGNYTISGLDVVRTTRVTANTMTVADSSKIQAWWKRNVEVKFSQMNGTDFVDDQYTAVLFLRNQIVVEGPDKTAIIHVSDIDAAIAAITKL